MATDPDNLPALIADDDPVLDVALEDSYTIERTKLRGKSDRADWLVPTAPPPTAIEAPDFVDGLRRFFGAMESEVDRYAGDPIATASALARIEALLGDVRYLRDRLKATTAASMGRERIRKLTVQGVVQVEASSEINRTNWLHHRLMIAALQALDVRHLDGSGAFVSDDTMAEWLLGFFRPEWRLTELRAAGIEPDDYCDIDRDQDGKIVRTPTVQIKDNRVKGRH